MVQTTGTLTASIVNNQVNPPGHPFIGDPAEMLMYRNGGHIHVSATQRLGPSVNHFNGINFRLPDLPADGLPHTYAFPGQAHAVYWAYEQGGVTPYEATDGSITVSLDAAQTLKGTFSFKAANGSHTVQVNLGQLELKGFITAARPHHLGTGHMRGDVVGGPMPTPAFDASVVSIRSVENGGLISDYWEVIGRQYDDFPPVQNLIAILVDKDVSGTSFDLANNSKVRVAFGRIDTFGFAYSISGRLTFTSLPATGHAVGHVDCQVQKNQEPPFTVKVTFDIREPV